MLQVGSTNSSTSASSTRSLFSARKALDESIYTYVVIGRVIGKVLCLGAVVTSVFAVQQFLAGATLPYIAAVVAAVALWIIGVGIIDWLDPKREEENGQPFVQAAAHLSMQNGSTSSVGAPSADPPQRHSWLDWFSSPPPLLADGEPVGFNNTANTAWWGAIANNCFMHAGLQLVLNEPDFVHAILDLAPARIPADPGQRGLERRQGFAYLHQVLQRVSVDVQSRLSVSGIDTTPLRGLYTHHIGARVQGDAHEFLRSILTMFTIQIPEGQNQAQLAHPELFFDIEIRRYYN
jgi:hypothetical protein